MPIPQAGTNSPNPMSIEAPLVPRTGSHRHPDFIAQAKQAPPAAPNLEPLPQVSLPLALGAPRVSPLVAAASPALKDPELPAGRVGPGAGLPSPSHPPSSAGLAGAPAGLRTQPAPGSGTHVGAPGRKSGRRLGERALSQQRQGRGRRGRLARAPRCCGGLAPAGRGAGSVDGEAPEWESREEGSRYVID